MRKRGRLVVSVAGRITVFLFLFMILILILYILGNFQDFTDGSILGLMQMFKFTSLIYIAVAVSYILILIIAGGNTGRKIGMRIAAVTAGILLSGAGFIIFEILLTGLEPVL